MNIEYKFITQKDGYYEKAVALRKELFFKDMPNAAECIQDAKEEESVFLVGINNNNVLGVGRLTIDGVEGVISQMAIQVNKQGTGIGKEIVDILINTGKELRLQKMVLSARETAIGFYSKFGFQEEGGFYASEKTGVKHKNMSLQLVKE